MSPYDRLFNPYSLLRIKYFIIISIIIIIISIIYF